MARCERCRSETEATTGSFFNTDMICLDCAEAERRHPDFERARRMEAEAVRRGDYNFPGVGAPADLKDKPTTQDYQDTAENAVRLIVEEAEGVFDSTLAITEMDSVVEGCWLVSMSDLSQGGARRRFLVYVGSHPEAPSWEGVDE